VLRLICVPLIARLFDGRGLRTELHPTGDFASYLGFLSGLDVGSACIGDDRFSLGRSDGKFIEMASRGVVCVASDLGEYRHAIDDGRAGLRALTIGVCGCGPARPGRLAGRSCQANSYKCDGGAPTQGLEWGR
jgi:hypothetical protein